MLGEELNPEVIVYKLPEKRRLQGRNYYYRNREKILVNRKRYYDKNKNKQAEYRKKNIDKVIIWRKNYYQTHKDYYKNYNSEYRKNNRERVRAINRLSKQRCKKRDEVIVDFKKQDAILARFGLTLDDVKKIANS